MEVAQSSPLVIGTSSIVQATGGAWLAPPPLLAEAANGSFLRADQFVFPADPGDKARQADCTLACSDSECLASRLAWVTTPQ